MKLKEIYITGLFGKQDVIQYSFNDDLNILTGKNGAGKTTVIKLAWFIISGNILLALREIDFTSCRLKTDIYECTVNKLSKDSCEIKFSHENIEYVFRDDADEDGDEIFIDTAEEKAAQYLTKLGSTIFFPTFRRIEGGFSIVDTGSIFSRSIKRALTDFDEALSNLSKKLSSNRHLFIAAISSSDINNLLLRKYADFSELINIEQQEISGEIIRKIQKFEDNESSGDLEQRASKLLLETKKDIENIEESRKKILQPMAAVNSLVEKLFNHAGISFGRKLSFGDAAEAINSNMLSAGEKQMLSFICYNAFYKDTIVFIDEPELSLHIDWQRELYLILKQQNPTNQFIFATHSPFIYAKYPDKELIIDPDKGNAGE
jgi:hypothetical protein|nr:ATP-binding protein [uncultured Cardiobacterium sp.]